MSALPKLIKLNPVVVKEVFNRLLGGHGDDSYSSPLSPADLLVTLHNIDPQKCDMKTIIKGESLCGWGGWWLRVLTLIRWWLIWPIQNDAKNLKNDWNPANGYSNERTQRELSNEYQYKGLDGFQRFSVLGLWIKVASALEGLKRIISTSLSQNRL